MGVRNARVDFLDAVDRQDIAGRLARELVRAVRSADRDCQRVALSAGNKIRCLRNVGQQLFTGHLAVCAMTVFLVAHHGFQRTEHTQFGFDRDADRMRELDHFARHFQVVFVAGDVLAVFQQRAVHHHRSEAGTDGGHADCWRLAVILMHHDRDVRIGFDCRFDQVAQEGFAGKFAGAGRGLHDDRRTDCIGGLHDRGNLFQIIDIECRQTITVFSGVVEQLTHGYESHVCSPNNKKISIRRP